MAASDAPMNSSAAVFAALVGIAAETAPNVLSRVIETTRRLRGELEERCTWAGGSAGAGAETMTTASVASSR
jgi:hypothetical protein